MSRPSDLDFRNHVADSDPVEPPLLDEATGLVSRVLSAARRHQIALLHDTGPPPEGKSRVGPRHLAALAIVATHGAMSVTALAELLEVTVTTASLVAKDLEENDLVERDRDPDDRRRTILRPSGARPEEIQAILEDRADPIRRTLTQLEPDQRDAFLRGLSLLEAELTQKPSA
jgi:DNA-binding MarR family transcriptional regulator